MRSLTIGCLVLVACGADATDELRAPQRETNSPSASSSNAPSDTSSNTPNNTPSDPSKTSGGETPTTNLPPGGNLVPGTTTRTFTIGGATREAIVIVPATIQERKLPLVIGLHGNGDTAAAFIEGRSQLAKQAADVGFVLVAPQGVRQTVTVQGQTVPDIDWDGYRSLEQGNIDLALLDAIVKDLVGSGSIDARRVVSYGYSQGGYLSFRFAIDRASVVSCGAVIAASSPLGPSLLASAARKVPFSIQIGERDFGYASALDTKSALDAASFPVAFHAIANAGHVPLPGDGTVPLRECLDKSLP